MNTPTPTPPLPWPPHLTRILPPHDALPAATAWLNAGHPVAFPTETVYGIGADARRPDAINKIYAAKGRPPGNPLIVHIPDIPAAQACTTVGGANGWSEKAQALAQHFWPGPLTLILPRGTSIAPNVSAGRNTLALRCPAHPVALALLHAFHGPLAAPSANRSGFTSPTSAHHVLAELDGRIPLILDGGTCAIGLESTVLDLTTHTPTILRPGAITQTMLQQIIGPVTTLTATLRPEDSAASPGQHSRHYAPRTPAFYFHAATWSHPNSPVRTCIHNAALHGTAVVLLTHDPALHLHPPHEVMLLPAEADAYARVLYASLRDADAKVLSTILILLPDTTEGLWAAVLDRLHRAALPLL